MTQFQYDAIVKIICSGAPALADELCRCLADLINENSEIKKEIKELKEPKESEDK